MSSLLISSSSSEAAPEVSAAFQGLLEVRVPLEVVLGTGSMTVGECLTLDRNRIVPLTQSAGADLQVVANGVILARGEVVIVEDSTAIRVTEIETPAGLEPA